jgi:hypothetical protein
VTQVRDRVGKLATPIVTDDEARRFGKTVLVRNPSGFRLQLEKLVVEKIAQATQGGVPEGSPAGSASATLEGLRQKANALKATSTWSPSDSDLRKGREALLREFDLPHNVPLTEFARLARKSRQQIYKDIDARRLLALDVGTRGRRIPDWQLDPVALKLTQEVLNRSGDIDAWTLYHALFDPMERLGGRRAVRAVRPGTVAALADAVLADLGVHPAERAVAGT